MNPVTQTVKNKGTTPLQGVLIIALILIGIMAASSMANFLVERTGSSLPTIGVWLLAALAAVYLMWDRVLEYRYTVADGMVYLERTFGSYMKVLDSFPLMDIIAYAPEAEMRAAHPEIKNAMRLTLRTCNLPRIGFLYRKNAETKMAIMQPDADMLRALWDDAARSRSRAEKWPGAKA